MATAWVQAWEESERGWGVHKDGYSLHASKADIQKFINDYWDAQPDAVPDVYSRPTGIPFQSAIEPGYEDTLARSKNGIRVYDWTPKYV
jgi:hypothetical protein